MLVNAIAFIAVALLTWIGTEVLGTTSIWGDLGVLIAVVIVVYVILYGAMNSAVRSENDKSE